MNHSPSVLTSSNMTKFQIIVGILALTCFTVGQAENKHDLTVKVDVNLVRINAVVIDQAGRIRTDLGQTDFRVWEDKVEQHILSVDAEDVPASIGIILDVSSSMSRKISDEDKALEELLENGDSEDEYMVVKFSDRARLAQTFTRDLSRLQRSLHETIMSGMTAMYDALYLGTERVNLGHHARKALLLITDGNDNRSRYDLRQVDEFLKETNIQIYPIGIMDGRSDSDETDDERYALQDLAYTSGGHAFFPNSLRELADICAKIATELKTQYVIAYKSTNASKDGEWRKIRVRLRRRAELKHLVVKARSGYYAPAE